MSLNTSPEIERLFNRSAIFTFLVDVLVLYRLKKRIRMVRVKLLVCPHEGNEVFGFAEIDDVVRLS